MHKPTEISIDLSELFRFLYQESLKNITPQEKENFETTIFVR
jgi:hypothetical protein